MKKFLILIIFTTALNSCSSNPRLSLASFESSESRGMGASEVQLNVQKVARLKAAQDYRAQTLSEKGTQDSSLGFGLHGGLGLLDFLDITYKGSFSGPFFAGIKAQLWGEPMNKAKSMNFSVGFRYAYGLYVASDAIGGGDVDGDASQKITRRYIIEMGSSELEGLIGFRVMDFLQLSLGYLKSSYSLNASFEEGIKDERKVDGKRKLIHLLTTMNFAPFLAQVDLGKGELTNTDDSQKIDELVYGVSFGLLF